MVRSLRLNNMADQNEEKENEEQEEQENPQTQQPPHQGAPLTPENEPPLTDEMAMPVQDGGIPQNASGVSSGQYDALDPVGNANIKFDQGNYQQIAGLPKVTADKIAQLMQTFVPLVEVALIELLGSNVMYKRTLGQCMPAFDNQGKLSIEFTFQYVIEQWIGTDIQYDAIQHDANYVLEKVKPVKANISKCEIDCTNGQLTLMGTI